MAKRTRDDEAAACEHEDTDEEEVEHLFLPATDEMVELSKQRDACFTQLRELRDRCTKIEASVKHLTDEYTELESVQCHAFLEKKLRTLQSEGDLYCTARCVCIIINYCKSGSYSLEVKRPWLNIVNHNDRVVFRIDHKGNAMTSTGKTVKFNILNVPYATLREQIKKCVWQ